MNFYFYRKLKLYQRIVAKVHAQISRPGYLSHIQALCRSMYRKNKIGKHFGLTM